MRQRDNILDIQAIQMNEQIDSDMAMVATASFNDILHHIQTSCLNYQVKITPFSANISIKKSFIKDRDGCPVVFSVGDSKFKSGASQSQIDAMKYFELEKELEKLRTKQNEYFQKLNAAYVTIANLRNIIEERDIAINYLTSTDKFSEEAAPSHYEKSEVFRQGQFKVNTWRYDVTDTSEQMFDAAENENGKFISAVKQETNPSLIQDFFSSDSVNHENRLYEGGGIHAVPSQVSHWMPSSHCHKRSNISSISSLRSHYVRLPNPGQEFSKLEHMEQEFRELKRAWREGQNCRQS